LKQWGSASNKEEDEKSVEMYDLLDCPRRQRTEDASSSPEAQDYHPETQL
jgi:hypothetical protein